MQFMATEIQKKLHSKLIYINNKKINLHKQQPVFIGKGKEG